MPFDIDFVRKDLHEIQAGPTVLPFRTS